MTILPSCALSPGREPSKATTGTKPDLRALKNKPQPVAAQRVPLSFPARLSGVDAADNSIESTARAPA